MAPKGKNKTLPKATATPTQPPPKTIGEKLQRDYEQSRPYQTLAAQKGTSNLSSDQKIAYAAALCLEDSTTLISLSAQQRKELDLLCEKYNIPQPLDKPRDLGTDRRGRRIAEYSLEQYEVYERELKEFGDLTVASELFRTGRRSEGKNSGVVVKKGSREEDIEEERKRRVRMAELRGERKVGVYGGDPVWDDVRPILQDDGEKPLAAIAYTDEYAEAISYLRAIMASNEHTPRVLDLTAHIISLNPAHYTVWLYRASTLFALNASLNDELSWVNEVALANQKNYQIWHHRQLLISKIFPTLTTRDEVLTLARSEVTFVTQMFEEDSKNYHVWSYRQYLVRTLSLFPTQTASVPDLNELSSIEALLSDDVRNNSAWSHRFFVVFSDPGICTADSKATEPDAAIPVDIIDREIDFSKSAIWKAPNNQSPWNYLRGVLRKGGRGLDGLECFAKEFVVFGDEDEDGDGKEVVKSSHALDFLADCWAAKGELVSADRALRLLGDRYDRIRRNYWEWRRESLSSGEEVRA